MNKVVDNFLKIRDKFMPEMHSRRPSFTYNACGPFIRNKQRIQILWRREIQNTFTEMN